MKKVWPVLVFAACTPVLAQSRQFSTQMRAVTGPPATAADILAARRTARAIKPQVIITSASLESFLLPAAIDSPGKNGTFFRTDFFVTNNRQSDQEILISWLPQGVSAAGLAASRFSLSANTVYLISDFLAGGAGKLSESGVGSLLVTGVVSGTNTADSNAVLEGGDRIWTFEPGSNGTNSFTMEGQFGDVFGTSTATAIGLRQDASFRANVGLVNLDTSAAHTWTVRVVGTNGQETTFNVNVPALSMVQTAVPAAFAPGNLFVEFTPDAGMAGEEWAAYGVSADNTTGDAWVSRGTQP
jgi:hypothetical protein